MGDPGEELGVVARGVVARERKESALIFVDVSDIDVNEI